MGCAPAISPRPAREGFSPPEAMQQSRHRSVQQASRYYNEAQIARGRAARLA
jgi:hypothetical protein